MISQFYFFFTTADEKAFSAELLKLRPNVRFVEELGEGAPLKKSLELFDSKWVDVVDFENTGSEFEGDMYSANLKKVNRGSFVRIERCVVRDDVMLSGTVLFGTREDSPVDPADLSFYKDVRKVAKKLNEGRICFIDFHPLRALDIKLTSAYIVGNGVQNWLKSDETTLLRNRSVSNFYLTREIVEIRTALQG